MSRSTFVALFATLAIATTAGGAHAQPTSAPAPVGDGYIGTGVSLAADEWIYFTGFLDGGVRITDSLWVRGRIDRGGGTDFEVSGDVTAASIGIEGRGCTKTLRTCGYFGLDLGGVHGDMEWDEAHGDHRLAAARIAMRSGLEVGLNRRLALRLGFDFRMLVNSGYRHDGDAIATGLGTDLGFVLRF